MISTWWRMVDCCHQTLSLALSLSSSYPEHREETIIISYEFSHQSVLWCSKIIHIYNNILVWFHLTMNEFVSTERWESWFVLLASGIVVDNLYDSDPESVSGDPATGESRLRSWDEIIFYKIFLTHLYSASLSAAAGLSKLWPLIWWWTLLPPPLVLLLADVARDLLHKHHFYKLHYYCSTFCYTSDINECFTKICTSSAIFI